jgi:hypothetical protein
MIPRRRPPRLAATAALGVVLLTLLASPSAWAATAMDGAWTVDLTTEPGTPYLKPMRLVLGPDGAVSGDFYDSPILAGRWKAAKGRLCVSFRTTDGQGPYHTSACLVGDRVEGQTWAEHRRFLFPWTAMRDPAAAPH